MEQNEHEIMIEYSEMTSFDFNSKEFREIQKDYMECRSFVTNVIYNVKDFFNKFRTAVSYR